MIAIEKKPGGRPELVEIQNTLDELWWYVEGCPETVPIAADVAIIRGRENNGPYNCKLFGAVFNGPILVVGMDGGQYTDLREDALGILMGGLAWA